MAANIQNGSVTFFGVNGSVIGRATLTGGTLTYDSILETLTGNSSYSNLMFNVPIIGNPVGLTVRISLVTGSHFPNLQRQNQDSFTTFTSTGGSSLSVLDNVNKTSIQTLSLADTISISTTGTIRLELMGALMTSGSIMIEVQPTPFPFGGPTLPMVNLPFITPQLVYVKLCKHCRRKFCKC